MTSVLLSFAIVLAWGTWIPLAQAVPKLLQATRTFYITAGNLVFATAVLVVGGSAGQLTLGWKEFWLPFAGGLVWATGSVCAFRATELIGLARASGTWTPLNIIVAFVFGALLFSELAGFTAARYAVLGGCLVLVLAGVFLIINSQNPQSSQSSQSSQNPQNPKSSRNSAAEAPLAAEGPGAATEPAAAAYRRGLLLAVGAGLLWGGYFVPSQWAHVPSQLGNFPLAVGMFAGASFFAARGHAIVRLPVRHTAVQLCSGVLLGVGTVCLLGLVPRVGTGVGFTIAQLSLLVNASVGIWVFKVPAPGSRAARIAIAGILLAGIGATAIGALR